MPCSFMPHYPCWLGKLLSIETQLYETFLSIYEYNQALRLHCAHDNTLHLALVNY